jgi:hypothetical protein
MFILLCFISDKNKTLRVYLYLHFIFYFLYRFMYLYYHSSIFLNEFLPVYKAKLT